MHTTTAHGPTTARAPAPAPAHVTGRAIRHGAVSRIAAGVARTTAVGVAVAVTLLLAPVVGIGCLYLLRHFTPLAAGPSLPDALPLQQLAGGDGQPLLRLVVVWALTGLAAGLGVAALSRLSRGARAALTGTATLVLLMATGAMSDSLTLNEPVSAHLAAQPGRAAIWLAAGLVALAALAIPSRRRAPR
jgi:hypothetical protein